jgi:hypothetical protein
MGEENFQKQLKRTNEQMEDILRGAEEDPRSAFEISNQLIWYRYIGEFLTLTDEEKIAAERIMARNHELAHFLHYYDPDQLLAKATGYYKMYDSATAHLKNIFNPHTHFELEALVEEWIDNNPIAVLNYMMDVLDDPNMHPFYAIAERWKRDTAIELILKQGPRKFGMILKGKSRFTLQEQILIQFLSLAKPEYQDVFRQLAKDLMESQRIIQIRVFKATDYSDEIETLRKRGPLERDPTLPLKYDWIQSVEPWAIPLGTLLAGGIGVGGSVFLWKRRNLKALYHFVMNPQNQKEYPVLHATLKKINDKDKVLDLVKELLTITHITGRTQRDREQNQIAKLGKLNATYKEQIVLGWNQLETIKKVQKELSRLIPHWKRYSQETKNRSARKKEVQIQSSL